MRELSVLLSATAWYTYLEENPLTFIRAAVFVSKNVLKIIFKSGLEEN